MPRFFMTYFCRLSVNSACSELINHIASHLTAASNDIMNKNL